MKFLSPGGFAWPRPGRAQETGTGAKGQAKNSTGDRNSLAAALRSRGGATQATKPGRKRPTRGRSRHSEVEQSSATSSASATSSTSATSTSEKRQTSWAPNATILAEQFGDLLHRGMEAAGQWRVSQEVAASARRASGQQGQRPERPERHEPRHLGGAQQRLQCRLQEWFAKQHEFQGAPPRLTSPLFPVQRGPMVYAQVLLVWRGIEIQLLLGPSERPRVRHL